MEPQDHAALRLERSFADGVDHRPSPGAALANIVDDLPSIARPLSFDALRCWSSAASSCSTS